MLIVCKIILLINNYCRGLSLVQRNFQILKYLFNNLNYLIFIINFIGIKSVFNFRKFFQFIQYFIVNYFLSNFNFFQDFFLLIIFLLQYKNVILCSILRIIRIFFIFHYLNQKFYNSFSKKFHKFRKILFEKLCIIIVKNHNFLRFC